MTTKKTIKEEKVEVCPVCQGTGRGEPVGFQSTSCKACKGTGK